MKVGDLLLGLGVDSADFKTVIKKEAESAGKEGALTLSKVFSTGIKAGSVLVGAAFALMTRGAMEMERAQGDFQRATGASREEAIKFTKDMNSLSGMAGTVGMSFEDIAAAGTMVAQQFGVTGEDAKQLTLDILEFAKVTGQDAAQAAGDLEDMLSAMGLGAGDAVGAMDKLVASSQKYGTDAGPAAVGALNDMAPALVAMGMGLDDGVELLNAFEVAGGDAGDAARGLRTAVAQLEPGQNLDDLITKIAAIEDPLLKNQAATDAFGKKMGPQLAALIKPGMDSLDDFGISAEESAGKVDTAAQDMLTTSDKFKMFAEKIGGFLREGGQAFGPLITAAATVGAPIAGALATSWGKVRDSTVVKGAAGAAGAAAVAAYNLGMKAIEALGSALSAAWTALRNNTVVKAVAGYAGAAAGAAYGVGMKVMEAITGPLSTAFAAIGRVGSSVVIAAATSGGVAGSAFGLGFAAAAVFAVPLLAKEFGEKTYDALQGVLGGPSQADFMAIVNARMQQTGAEAGTALGTSAGAAVVPALTEALGPPVPPGWFEDRLGEPVTRGWWEREGRQGGAAFSDATRDALVNGFQEDLGPALDTHLVGTLRESMLEAHRIAAWGGAQTPGEFSQGLRSDFDSIRSAFTDLKDLMKNTLSPIQQEAELIAIATSKRMAQALADGRPEVRSEAQQIALDSIAQLHKLAPGSEAIGTLSMKLLAGATEAEKPAIRDAIAAILGVAEVGLDGLPGIGSAAGAALAASIARGIASKERAVRNAVSGLANIVKSGLLLESPAKEGPWSEKGGPIEWARQAMLRTIGALVDTAYAGGPEVKRALGSLLSLPGVGQPVFGLGLTGVVRPIPGMPDLGDGTQTIRHEHDLTPDTVALLRDAGYDESKVARFLTDYVGGAYQARHVRFSTSTG